MNLLALYLHDLNRQYLSTRADRRQLWREGCRAVLLLALFLAVAVILWGVK